MDDSTMIEMFAKLLDEHDKRLADIIDQKLIEQSQQIDDKLDNQSQKITSDLKDFIQKNNISIGEILTAALESTDGKIDVTQEQICEIQEQLNTFHKELQKLVNVTKNNTYEITNILEQKQA